MSRRVYLSWMVMLVSLAARPAWCEPATQPASNTSGALRVAVVRWDQRGPAPDFDALAALLRESIAPEAVKRVLGTESPQSFLSRLNLNLDETTCTVELEVRLPLGQNLPMRAGEVADEIVATLRRAVRSDVGRQMSLRVEMAERQVSEAMSRLESLRVESRSLEAQLREKSGRSEASPMALRAAMTKLDDERQAIELELAELRGRRDALQQNIQDHGARLQAAVKEDAIAIELAKVVEGRSQELDRMRDLQAQGKATTREVSAAVTALAEARAHLADRRVQAAASSGGDMLTGWNRDLMNLAVDTRAAENRLAAATERARRLQEAGGTIEQLEQLIEARQEAMRTCSAQSAMLAELRLLQATQQPPAVVVKDGKDW